MREMSGVAPSRCSRKEKCVCVWRPALLSGAKAPLADGLSARERALFRPMFLFGRRRILIEGDLFAADLEDASIDLVHAVIAVSHWHSFLFLSDAAERMRGYWADSGTPRRIAEEIDLLSLAALESPSARLSPRLLAGFARVRYGLAPSGGSRICPLSPDPWPLANLALAATGARPLQLSDGGSLGE